MKISETYRAKKTQPYKNNQLALIFEKYTKQPDKAYTLTVRGTQMKLVGQSNQEFKSVLAIEEQSKGKMKIFSNIASKFRSKSSHKNKSPLRLRENRNYINQNSKLKEFKQIPKIQSKVREYSTTPAKNNKKNKKINANIPIIKTAIDNILVKEVQLSFQNLAQDFGQQNLNLPINQQYIRQKEIETPQIIVHSPKSQLNNIQSQINININSYDLKPKQPEQMLDNSIIQYTDSELQKIKNPYASFYGNSMQKLETCMPTPGQIAQDIGVEDLDINMLIHIEEEQSNSPIKLIERYHIDFSLKDSLRPKQATSHVYEAPRIQERC